jgi:hypothetical protein
MKKVTTTLSSDYTTTENHILFLAEDLSVKETIHISQMLLFASAARLSENKRVRRMVETLAADVAKLEDEIRG